MKILKTREVKTPTRANATDAGIDFFVPEDFEQRVVNPGESVLIPSGIKANVPAGFALIVFNKSGVATKKQLFVGAEVIDEDYQGEMHIHLVNVGNEVQTISPGDKITQMILIPMFYDSIEEVKTETDLFPEGESSRGAGGFGSTGTK